MRLHLRMQTCLLTIAANTPAGDGNLPIKLEKKRVHIKRNQAYQSTLNPLNGLFVIQNTATDNVRSNRELKSKYK